MQCRGEFNHAAKGQPNLTSTVRSLIIPENARVSVNILESDFQDFKQTPIAPARGPIVRPTDPADVPYEFGEAYRSDTWSPEIPSWSARTYVLRDYHGADIELCPFQYDPQTQTLRVYTRMMVEILTDGGLPMQSSGTKAAVRAFTEIYADHFVNYRAVTQKYSVLEEQGDMLIIAVDRVCDALAPFIEWKKQKGIDVTLLPIAKYTPVPQIQALIQNAYDNDPSLAFVLLVGGGWEIYAPIGGFPSVEGPCDPIYARVAGEDDYPDLIIGRFSGSQAYTINKEVARSIYYERDLVDNGTVDWLTRSLGIADTRGRPYMQWLVQYLAQHGYASTGLYDFAGDTLQTQELIDALEVGRGYINYGGHGNQGCWATGLYGSSDISQTATTWKLPFIISDACQNGAYDWGCFAEAWLTATDVNGDPRGAVATWMCSRQSSYDYGAEGESEFARSLINGTSTTFGGLCFDAASHLIELDESDGGTSGTSQAEIWTVFGDPSLVVRTDIPEPLQAQYAADIDWDANQYFVTVTDPGTGQYVEGALCALYCGGELHGRGYTDANGLATLTLNPGSPLLCSEAVLTVTGFNRETVQEPVTVLHDIAIAVDPMDDTTRNCIESPEVQDGYWIECEVFSSHPLFGSPEIKFTTGVDGSWPPPAWTAMFMNDLGDNRWGRYVPLQYAGATVRYTINARNTNNDTYVTPEDSFFVKDYGVEIDVDQSMLSAFEGRSLWYDMAVINAGVLQDTYTLAIVQNNWPSTIYDADGINVISTTPVLQAGDTLHFKVKIDVTDPIVDALDLVVVSATSDNSGDYDAEATLIAQSKGVTITPPFVDYFSEQYVNWTRWQNGDHSGEEAATASDALYSDFTCWPNAVKLAGGHPGLGTVAGTHLVFDRPIRRTGVLSRILV